MKYSELTQKTLVAVAVAAAVFASSASSFAEEPPLLFRGGNHILIGVSFDEETVRSMLPSGLEPTDGITGGINLYRSKGGSGFGPYTRAYVWVDIAGYDSADGSKARYIVWGVNGPDESLVAALGKPFVLGEANHEADGANRVGVAIKGGNEAMKVAVQSSEAPCESVAGTLHYIFEPSSGLMNMVIPWAGDVCGATPIAVEFADFDKKLASLRPTSLLWAAEARDMAFAIATPVGLK